MKKLTTAFGAPVDDNQNIVGVPTDQLDRPIRGSVANDDDGDFSNQRIADNLIPLRRGSAE